MVGSTALSERFDPEDLGDLFSSYQQVCREAIGHAGGYVSQFLGDGVLAYFGWPQMQEDDAVRAVRAALSILASVDLVNEGIGKRLGAEIEVRIGLHTGVAVVGDSRSGGLAVGETVNLAARIEAFADRNMIVISAATAQLVAGYFELEAFNPQLLRGFSRPVDLFRVVRATLARTKFEAAALGKLSRHVGRDEELSGLRDLWQDVLQGASRVVVVRGEAGIGKSRLMHEFRHNVVGSTALVLECFCSPLTRATALAPFIEMIEGRIQDRAGATASQSERLETLRQMLSEHSRFGPDSLPLMAALLSIPVPEVDEEPIASLSLPRRRMRTFEVICTWLSSFAERIPIALFIEDIHWADPSTLDFLDVLVRQTHESRTLFFVTGRPEFLVRWSQPHVHRIELSRLSGENLELLTKDVAGERSLSPLLMKRIVERSEGVPLFVEEITKAVLETGEALLNRNRFDLVGSFDEQALPSAGFASIVARFDLLKESRRIAQLGAAIGRDFTYELIHAVSDMSDSELRSHLDRLLASELALVQGSPPDATYSFKHALVQDAIYATLLKKERVQTHERVFVALTERFPHVLSERPEMAAYHAERAGLRDVAVRLHRKAGGNALERTALAEAVQHFERAIELVESLHEPERSELELELQAAVAPAYMTTLGWGAPEVERAIARWRELATLKGDTASLLAAMWSRWTVEFLRGSLDSALQVAQEVFAMTRQADAPMLRVLGHHALGYTLFYRGEYAPALEHARDGIALFDLDNERWIASTFQFSSTCAMYCYQAEALLALGQTDEAEDSIVRLRKLVADLEHTPSQAYSLGMQLFYYHSKADAHEVRELARTLRTLSVLENFALWAPVADSFIAWSDARLGGDANEACERMRAAKIQYDNTRTRITEIELTCALAEVLLLARRPDAVQAAVEFALQNAGTGHVRHYQSELLRLQAVAAFQQGNARQANEYCARALESAEHMGAKGLASRIDHTMQSDVTSFTALSRLAN